MVVRIVHTPILIFRASCLRKMGPRDCASRKVSIGCLHQPPSVMHNAQIGQPQQLRQISSLQPLRQTLWSISCSRALAKMTN